ADLRNREAGRRLRHDRSMVPRPHVRDVGVAQLNIILVTGASARARTITVEWRHWLGGGAALLAAFVALAVLFDYVAIRWAAETQRPWFAAMVLGDGNEAAQRTQERLQGHLSAMAIRVGELQARIMRLDGLGERLAAIAGLKPAELSALQSQSVPGTGG